MHFYDNENNIYVNHIDALKSKKPCRLYYEDDFFQTVAWAVRPHASLNDLYRMRAEEIRSSYDKVILCLSGEVDSRNVFETFYHNDILIDEILCVGAYSQDIHKGVETNNNDEIHNNVTELLKDARLPSTTITYFDYSTLFDRYTDFSLVQDYGDDWAFHMPYFKSFHHFFWYDMKKHLKIDDSKKTCYVMGTGKTRVVRTKDDRFCVYFSESDLMDYGARYKVGNFFRENFYFGATNIAAEIVKKQAYMLKDFNLINFRHMTDLEYPQFLYNLKCPLITPTRKCSTYLFSHRDTFMNNHTNSEFFKLWYSGLQKVSEQVSLRYRPHDTRPYFLGS